MARPLDDGARPDPVVLAAPALPGRAAAEPRWRGVAWCYGLLALPGIVGLALLPGPQPGGFFELGPIPNPLGWEAAGEVLRPVNAMAQVVATALLGAAAVSIVLRLRRVGGVSVNSSNGWPPRPFCSPATTSLPSCTRGGRSAASPR